MTDRDETPTPDNVRPTPDLQDISVGAADAPGGDDADVAVPVDPPIEDLTLPTE